MFVSYPGSSKPQKRPHLNLAEALSLRSASARARSLRRLERFSQSAARARKTPEILAEIDWKWGSKALKQIYYENNIKLTSNPAKTRS